jgi:E3 ubiquitin-protein ligase makorin
MPPAQVPCKFFKAGYCSRGETCWFKHEAPKAKAGEGEPAAAASTVPATAAEDEEPCAICFDKPETYGLMTGCDHVFCLSKLCLSLSIKFLKN